jgi:hypothetical protein
MPAQDGMYVSGDFLTKCCHVKAVGYRADDYPYDCGCECPKCGKQWSVLQMARREHEEAR